MLKREGGRLDATSSRNSLSAFALLTLCICAAFGADTLRARSHQTYEQTRTYDPQYYMPPSAWLPVLSLGYREALADMLWCKTLVYYGEEIGKHGPMRFAWAYADAMLALDPDFRAAYLWAGTTAIYRTQAINADDVRQAIKWLERARRKYPDDGEIAWELGSAWAFELPGLLPDANERTEALRRAMPHLEFATRAGFGPAWMALTNVSYLQRLGQTQQAIHHLEEMYAAVSDPAARAEMEQRLAELRGRAFTDAMVATTREFDEARRRDFPYLDATMYMLIGARATSDAPPAQR